jgi:uncharacterized protein (DUF433 family)
MARYPLNLPDQLKQDAELLANRQGISLNQFVMWSVAEKVAALQQRLDDPAFPQITYRRGATGWPEPVLRGTGIRVQSIAISSLLWHKALTDIAEEYGLTQSQVQEAINFYQAHRSEIDAQIVSEESLEVKHV